MGLLDVIGPVMVGPSSSHTAGACRLALLARHTLLAPPRRAKLILHGSFAKTARGHGTDLALAAGLQGCQPDDPRIPNALELAADTGLEIEFSTRDLGDVHPNTVRLELENDRERVAMQGSSLGGGLVKVTHAHEFEVSFSGSYHTLLVRHTDQLGVIARVARVIADDEVNIATLYCARQRRGGEAMMSIEVDRRLSQYVLDYLTHLPYIHWMRMLPEVMTGGERTADAGASHANAEAPGTKSGTAPRSSAVPTHVLERERTEERE